MYSIQKAAEMLGKSETTVRRWMKSLGIKVVELETDRRRVYIADDDMNVLVDSITQKIASIADKTRKYHRPNRDVIVTGEGTYYSFAGAASLLRSSAISVKRWSKRDNIEIKLIGTDRRRGYISEEDVLRMAELHRRKILPKALADMDVQRDGNATQTDMDKLYSVREVALYLDVSLTTARRWIREANMEIKKKFVGKVAACITYRDVVHLADLHKCEVLPSLSPLSVREEMQVIRGKMEMMASDIEDLKHDFRLLVKRSIYVG